MEILSVLEGLYSRICCIIIYELRIFVGFGSSQGIVVPWNCQLCTCNLKKTRTTKQPNKPPPNNSKKKNNLNEEMYPRVFYASVTLCLWLQISPQLASMLKTSCVILFFFLWPSSCTRPSGATWQTVKYFNFLYLLIRIEIFF